jgi:hypothetical protein
LKSLKIKRNSNWSLNPLNTNSGPTVIFFGKTMEDFRVPIHLDHSDLYITEAQLQFYLNDLSPTFKVKDILSDGQVSRDFILYYEKCATYNLIWDLSDRYPKSSKMYWDEKHQEFRITYPKDGIVFKELKNHGLSPSTL